MVFVAVIRFPFLPSRLTQIRNAEQMNKYNSDTDLKYNKIKCSSKCFGGATERITYVQQARAKHNHTVLLDVGGMWHGSTFAYKFKGSVSAEFASQMKYDVMGTDQADFFNGPSGYVNFLKGCFNNGNPIPVVSSNLVSVVDTYSAHA